jgi:hypothetical protein
MHVVVLTVLPTQSRLSILRWRLVPIALLRLLYLHKVVQLHITSTLTLSTHVSDYHNQPPSFHELKGRVIALNQVIDDVVNYTSKLVHVACIDKKRAFYVAKIH